MSTNNASGRGHLRSLPDPARNAYVQILEPDNERMTSNAIPLSMQPDGTTAAELEQEFVKTLGEQGFTYYGAIANESGENYAYKEFNVDSWTTITAIAITEGPCKAFVTISSNNYLKNSPVYRDYQISNISYDAMTFFTTSDAQNFEFMYGYKAADIGKGNCNTWLLIFYKFD
ncbi:MAG: hypothetical protein R2794_06665 [Chitinophagales bacterium]